jgi:hypothetical protein
MSMEIYRKVSHSISQFSFRLSSRSIKALIYLTKAFSLDFLSLFLLSFRSVSGFCGAEIFDNLLENGMTIVNYVELISN